LESGDGHLVVRDKGGRVAELRPGPGLDDLFFGGLPDIDGGDRMWIAPEVEIFYEGPPEDGKWRCPPELDPGDWSMERAAHGVELRQSALGAELVRRVTPLEQWDGGDRLRWSGYRMTSAIESSQRWSAWQLVMLPAPADIFVRHDGDPVDY
jgi:hypothetical protein